MKVRITEIPPGEAPEEIRRAWVGLVLPLAPGANGPQQHRGYGVLSSPRTVIGYLWRRLTGRGSQTMMFYAVPSDRAIEVLERACPIAADWWRENTPHLLQSGVFGFPAKGCEEISE